MPVLRLLAFRASAQTVAHGTGGAFGMNQAEREKLAGVLLGSAPDHLRQALDFLVQRDVQSLEPVVDRMIAEADIAAVARERNRCIGIVLEQFQYWRDSELCDPAIAIGATGACSNVVARIAGLIPPMVHRGADVMAPAPQGGTHATRTENTTGVKPGTEI